jgi:hypothetical protein
LNPAQPNYALAGCQDNGTDRWRGSNTWDMVSGGDGGYPAFSSIEPNQRWAVSYNNLHILRTLDGGTTVTPAQSGIDTTNAELIPPLKKSPADDDIFLAGTVKLWKCTNFFSGPTPMWFTNGPDMGWGISAVAFAPSDSTSATYAFGTGGGQLRVTTNGGASWTDANPANAVPDRYVTGLAFDPTNANILYVSLSGFDEGTPGQPGHLFKTSNALAASPTWSNISPPVDLPHECVAVEPLDPTVIYVGTDVGVWWSDNGGGSWSHMGPASGMPNVPVYDLQINGTTGQMIAFTYGRGAFTLGWAQGFPNPSFEANSFTVGPGYVRDNAPIVGWNVGDPTLVGLNPASGNPFADNGTVPDGANVAFIQRGANSSLSTVLPNLTVNQTYKVNFRVNARSYLGTTPNLKVDIAGTNVIYATIAPVGAAGSTNAYRYFAFDFTAPGLTTTLTLRNDATNNDNTVLLDNFSIAPRNSGWSYAAWNDDASSGVVAGGNYTHTYHFGSSSNATLNGITFTGVAGPNPSNSLFSTTGLPAFTNDVNHLTTGTGGSAVLAHDFVYGGSSESITINGLVAGKSYVATIYSVGFDTNGARAATFSVGNDRLTVNQDQFGYHNGIRLSYNFTANSASTTLTYAPLQGSGQSFYTYGFCNRERSTVVTSLADSGAGTLRQAIADAHPGDTITFATIGTITLASGQISISTSLTIDASAMAGSILVAGNGTSRLFQISPTATVTLKSLILASGAVSRDTGGAILNSGQLTALNCLFTNNIAQGGAGLGGAIFSDGGLLTLSNCVFMGNRALGGGGGAGLGNSDNNDPGGSGGGPNAGSGGAAGNPGGGGGYGGGGGGGGALGAGGDGGVGGLGGAFGGLGGAAHYSNAGGGGGGAGLGGAVFVKTGAVTVVNCTFSGNLATNGLGGYGSFGFGNGQPGQGIGGALFFASLPLVLQGNAFSSNTASSSAPDLIWSLLVSTIADGGDGSLREAVAAANAAQAAATIRFDGALSSQTLLLAGGELVLDGNLTIDASALSGGFTISGNHSNRIFEVNGGATVTLNSLSLMNGYAGSGAWGGAIQVDSGGVLTLTNCAVSGNSASGAGGGIATFSGVVNINNSTISSNSASGAAAIENDAGTLTINASTLSGNVSTGNGGAIDNDASATLLINNSTFSGNSAGGAGGSIENYQSAATLNNCTLSANSATFGGGINNAGTLALTNTIVAGNTAPNSPNIGGAFLGIMNLTDGNPLLAPLGNYGGPTLTMPPLLGSPAIDGGTDSVTNSLATDQRGFPRRSGALVDIGAVEAQWASGGNPPLLSSPASGTDGTFSFSFTYGPAADFTVLGSSKVGLPMGQWGILGAAAQYPPGQYHFTDPNATNYLKGFYRVVSP